MTFVYPPALSPAIRRAGAAQPPYPRTAAFAATVMDIERRLLALVGCPDGRVIPLAASGTGAMEAVVANLLGPDVGAVVVNGGTFGQRWLDLCRYRGVPAREVAVPFGCDLCPAGGGLSAALRAAGAGRRAVLMQHHETSSGQLFDLAAAGAACRAAGALLVVDAIGSLLCDPFNMQADGVDAAVISSHKGLCLPPGLAFVVLGPRALAWPRRHGSFYFDFDTHLTNLERGQSPYTPASTLMLQVHARLSEVGGDGGRRVRERVRAKADRFRALVQSGGLRLCAETPSAGLTGVWIQGARRMAAEWAGRGVYVMPSCRDDLVRVAHVGATTRADHVRLARLMLEWAGKRPRERR